jgi:hypothetical protein
MFLDLLDLYIPILHVPLDSWLGRIRNKRQRTDEFWECTTNAARGHTVKHVIDKAPRIVLRNMVHCLLCSFMTKPQLHHIQKKMILIRLSKRGCSSKTARAVVFGPRRFLGTGDRHLYYEQGIGATLQLLKHIRANSKLGDFLKIGLNWTQLHAGVSFPILENTRRALAGLVCINSNLPWCHQC